MLRNVLWILGQRGEETAIEIWRVLFKRLDLEWIKYELLCHLGEDRVIVPSVTVHCIQKDVACGQGVLAVLLIDEFVNDEEKVYLRYQ